jgi:hypothetical protein
MGMPMQQPQGTPSAMPKEAINNASMVSKQPSELPPGTIPTT